MRTTVHVGHQPTPVDALAAGAIGGLRMSGVFGVVDAGRRGDVTALAARMGAALCHRPWYVVETGADLDHGAALGRVGIGIFNREAQSVRSAGGTLAVCFAGELYRTAPLWAALDREGVIASERSDAALVLHLYAREGRRFIHRLEGIFVTAI